MNSASRRETGARNPGKVGGILLLAGLLGLFFAAPASAQSVCVVSGQVLDISSAPVPNTNVRFRVISPTPPYATQDLTTKTAADGSWSLTLVQGLNAQVDIPAIGVAKDTVIPTGASCPAAFTSLTLFNRGTLTPATILSTTGPSMGGDLTGSSPNPTVVGLRGQTLASGTCAVGQAYVKAAGQFTCQNVTAGTSVTSITGGTAITVSGTAAVPIVGVTAGSITNTQLGSGAAATNLGAAGGALAGTYPSPTLASGVAATNVGALGGDLSGTLPSPTVATVGGTAAATLATGAAAANAATATNTVSTIVKRDSSGNFAAGTITGALSGNASTATALSSTLTGDASSVGNAVTVLGLLTRPLSVTPPTAGQALTWNGSAWAPASAVGTVTSVNALGGGTGLSFSGGPITGAGTLTLQGTLGIGFGGTGATTIASGFNALSPMTSLGDMIYGGAAGSGTRLGANTAATRKFVMELGDGVNGAAPIFDILASGDIPNNAANTSGSAASFTGALVGDVTGTQGATAVALVGGSTAANVNTATVAANAATNANTVATIVKRDGLGNFSAGTITANLAGNVTGALTGNATTSSDGLTSASGTAPLTLNLAAKALTGSIATFGAANSGVVPLSGGGTANFLRADGSWAAPTGLASVSLQGSTPGTPDTGNSNVSGMALAGAFGVTNTAGSGFLDMIAQASNPAAPPAGTARFHAFTTDGFTRFEQDNEAATNLTLGRDNVYVAKNTSGATITKGTVVYVSDHVTTRPVVLPAKADSLITLPAAGIALDDITTGNFGQVMRLGLIENVNTSSWSPGDKLWVSSTVAGGMTNVRPVAPAFAQNVAIAINSNAATGSILVSAGSAIGNTDSGTNTNFAVAGTLGVTGVTTLTGGLNTPLTVPNGGSGAATLTGVVHGNGASAMTAGAVAAGSELSGQVPIANGGTGAATAAAGFNALSPTTAAGDIIYANGVSSNTRLAGNATATKNFLSMTSSVPAWGALVSGDIPNNAANTSGTAANVTGTVAIANGGTGQTTATAALNALGGIAKNGTIPLTADWNAVSSAVTPQKISSENSINWHNVKAYGAVGDGVTNDTTAVANAIAAAVAGVGASVYFPPGIYLITPGIITIGTEGVTLRGDSTGGTLIRAAAGVAGVVFTFSNGLGTVNNCGIYDMLFTSLDTTTQKTMVQVLDGVNFSAARIKSPDLQWKGSTSIGFDIRGRQEIRLRDLDIYADQPIYIGANPNFASLSFDHSSIESSELVVTTATSNPVIKVADGLALTNSAFDKLALVRGAGGIFFSNTTMATASQNIQVTNIRCEQGVSATAYCLDFESTNGAIQNLAVKTAQFDATARGVKLRKVVYSSFDGLLYGNAAGEFWNADNTCLGLTVSNSFRQSGSTITDTSVNPTLLNTSVGSNPSASVFGSLSATSLNPLQVGTTGAFQVDSSGRIGFGTTAPDAAMTVANGSFHFLGGSPNFYNIPAAPATANLTFQAAASGSVGYGANGASLLMQSDASNNGTIYFATNTATRMRLDSAGRFYTDIGTAGTDVAQIGGTIFTQTADSTTTANTLTTVFGTGVGSLTLPANALIVGRTIRIRAGGYISAADGGAGTKTLNVYLGGSIIATATSGATMTTVLNAGWVLDATITCRSVGAGGTVQAGGSWMTQIANASPVGVITLATAASTANTTGTLAIDVRINNGNATGTIRTTYASVEILN